MSRVEALAAVTGQVPRHMARVPWSLFSRSLIVISMVHTARSYGEACGLGAFLHRGSVLLEAIVCTMQQLTAADMTWSSGALG